MGDILGERNAALTDGNAELTEGNAELSEGGIFRPPGLGHPLGHILLTHQS